MLDIDEDTKKVLEGFEREKVKEVSKLLWHKQIMII